MYAVVDDRGRQYKVAAGDTVVVEKIDSPPGTRLDFGRVLLLRPEAGAPILGTPAVEGARVEARVLGEAKGPKLISLKYRRRKNSHVKKGHRQHLTRLQVTSIHAP